VESSNRIITHPGGQPREMVRDSEMAIRNSQLLVDGMEQEAGQINSSQQRDRLLNAASMFFEYIKYWILELTIINITWKKNKKCSSF